MQAHDIQMQRLKQALNVESDNAFAQALDISQGAISGAKKRGQIPHSWFFQVSERTNFSVDWLFSGVGSMRIIDAPIPDSVPAPAETQEGACPRCTKLDAELETERRERRELTVEGRLMTAENRELTAEVRHLWKENSELREKCARFEERQYQHSISHDGGEAVG